MHVNVSFQRMSPSPSLRAFFEAKVERLTKFLKPSEELDLHVQKEADKFSPTLKLNLRGKQLRIKAQHSNPHKAVMELIRQAQRVLSKRHSRLVSI